MKKLILIPLMFAFSVSVVLSQDIIYTISGQFDEENISLDSILIENITNGTKILFDDLPENPDYQINLTKKQYWGTTGINSLKEEPGFVVLQNIPGKLSLLYSKNTPTDVNVSIYNIKGQKIYTSGKKTLHANNIIRLELESVGVFLVKLESQHFVQSFKTIGSNDLNNFNINVTDRNRTKINLKSTTIVKDADFSFEVGDSLRISSFKKGYYAPPTEIKVENSQTLNFQFNKNYLKINDNEYLFDGGLLFVDDDGDKFKSEELMLLTTGFNFNFAAFVNNGTIDANGLGTIISFMLNYTTEKLESGIYNISNGEEMLRDTIYVDMDLNGDELIDSLDFLNPMQDGQHYIKSWDSYYESDVNLYNEGGDISVELQSGSVIIARDEDFNTIEIDCVSENGDVIKGFYSGLIHYYSYGEELTINVIDVDSWSPVNPSGDFVESAIVKLLDRNNPNINSPLYEGITNSEGNVIFAKVMPGDYFVYIEKGEKSNIVAKKIINGEEVGFTISAIFQNQAEVDQSVTLPGAQPGDPKLIDVNEDGILNNDDKTIGNIVTIKGPDEYTFFISGKK
jgi:hypothetical protein